MLIFVIIKCEKPFDGQYKFFSNLLSNPKGDFSFPGLGKPT